MGRLIQPVGTGYTSMVNEHEDGVYEEALPSRASAMPCHGVSCFR